MKKKSQILLIHGGETFKRKSDYLHFLKTRTVSLAKKKSWSSEYFDKKLSNKFDIIRPRMPLGENAKYNEWKIHFERYLPLLKNNLVLIGVSLGGIFLARYLSENNFPKKISALYLVSPPFDNTLPGDDLVGGFRLKADLSLIEKNTEKIRLLFSKNDDVVPPSQAEKYRKKLKNANIIIYKHIKGHFQISEFPEIVKMIIIDTQKV